MTTASIDKIDANKGYTKDNCEIVAWWYNCAKQTYSNKEVYDFCKMVVSTYDTNPVQNVERMEKIPAETTYPFIVMEVSTAGLVATTSSQDITSNQ